MVKRNIGSSKELLTEKEYDAARSSTLNAHYTSPTVIRAMYNAIEKMGFRTGNVLEPSCGVGNFFGMLPDAMQRQPALWRGTGQHYRDALTRLLYPDARIAITGFEKRNRKDFLRPGKAMCLSVVTRWRTGRSTSTGF